MKILFIEDEQTVIAEAMNLLTTDGIECATCLFSHYDANVESFKPDILVLDLMEIAGDATPGKSIYEAMLHDKFRPVIIYSANPDLLPVESHPLIRKVKKGRGSPAKVKSVVEGFKPCVDSICAVKNNIDKVLHETLQHVVPIFWGGGAIPNISVEDLAKRRIAATLSTQSCGREKLFAWEQFVFPPLGESPLSGDILWKRNSEKNDPKSFRLLLTPSCDMANHPTRGPKVSQVLCAMCEDSDGFLKNICGETTSVKKRIDYLTPVLNQGFHREFVPIPGLDKILCPMVANLKKLEVINLNSIKNDDSGEYQRVVSVDSPFREQIVWAFMQTGCRPGVPDRDTEAWAKQYIVTTPAAGTTENVGH
jgi:CTP synthase